MVLKPSFPDVKNKQYTERVDNDDSPAIDKKEVLNSRQLNMFAIHMHELPRGQLHTCNSGKFTLHTYLS